MNFINPYICVEFSAYSLCFYFLSQMLNEFEQLEALDFREQKFYNKVK